MREEVLTMLRTVVILCLVLMIALSFGCSKKKEEAPKPDAAKTEAAGAGALLNATSDPVTKEEVDIGTSQYSFEYKGVIYHFMSEKNMETFKADPEKYITPAETPQTAPQTAPATTPPKGQ
jgi:YHS domain-containing protein